MQRFKIVIFAFSKASVQKLLGAAAAAALDHMGAFVNGLAVICTIIIFCEVHEKRPFRFFVRMCGKCFFHASYDEICFVYFFFGTAMVIGNL